MKRQERIASFNEFYNKSKVVFEKLSSNSKSHQRFNDIYAFHVAPGGRNGGLNEKIIDIFYGYRPIGRENVIDGNLNITSKMEVESGASLRYLRNDNGSVTCFLFPAKSENMHMIEDGILIDHIEKTSNLETKSSRHWKMFISYMETTSLDGEPNIFHKIMSAYLKNFKSCIVNRVPQEKTIKKASLWITKFVLSVGLSGFLIFIVSQYLNKSGFEKTREMYEDKFLKMFAPVVEIKNNSDGIASHVNSIESKIDSIITSIQKLEEDKERRSKPREIRPK